MIIILIGKSASGKDTLLNEMIKDGIEPMISTTSRPIRDGEEDGVDYNFVSKDYFENHLDSFLEYRSYNTLFQNHPDTWYYGSPKVELDPEKDYVKIVDIDGAKSIIDYYGKENTYTIYLDVPDDIREQRAKQRGSFNITEWNRRLQDDNIKFSQAALEPVADLLVLNKGITLETLKNFIYENILDYKIKNQLDNQDYLKLSLMETYYQKYNIQIPLDAHLGDGYFDHCNDLIEQRFSFLEKYGLSINFLAYSHFKNDKILITDENENALFIVKSKEITKDLILNNIDDFINDFYDVFPSNLSNDLNKCLLEITDRSLDELENNQFLEYE